MKNKAKKVTGILITAKGFKQGNKTNEVCVLKLSLRLQDRKQIDSRQEICVCG